MISNLPTYISLIFGIATIATLLLFSWAVKNSATYPAQKKAPIILVLQLAWLIIQGGLALNHVFSNNLQSLPPKLFLLGLLPPILLIILLLVTKAGRAFIDELPLKQLTALSVVRVLVEIVLLLLYLNKVVPKIMTFEGGNLDILSGLSAPLVAYLAFRKPVLNRKLLLFWNFVCLALLINVVTRALLSVPFPFQKLAFDQPNTGILYFPFIWLPTFVVPLVLFSHVASIRKLLTSQF